MKSEADSRLHSLRVLATVFVSGCWGYSLGLFYCVHTFCGLSGWGGWGYVNVPWKRYVTYAGVGVGGGGVMLTFLGSVT